MEAREELYEQSKRLFKAISQFEDFYPGGPIPWSRVELEILVETAQRAEKATASDHGNQPFGEQAEAAFDAFEKLDKLLYEIGNASTLEQQQRQGEARALWAEANSALQKLVTWSRPS